MIKSPLRILVDIGHPAHVHLFRNAIKILQTRGHHIAITTRDKDVAVELLRSYGLAYKVVSKARRTTVGLAWEMLEHDFGVLKEAIKQRSQLLIGTSVAITHVAPLIGAKSIVFNEDDASVAKSFVRLSYPLASRIVTPAVLDENHGKKHITYQGIQKLAYLHPNYFTPNAEVVKNLGVQPGERYFLLRLVTLKAAHDQGEYGMNIDLQRRLISLLSQHGRVFITSESPLHKDFEPYRIQIDPSQIHHVLAFADIFIGDSQSMNVEASILGIPSLRINSFADRCSILQELQSEYQLSYAFFPEQEEEIFATLHDWLADPDLKKKWQEKKERLLRDKIDVTAWMVAFIESFAEQATQ
jgi:predicted glycosyltransferase